MKLTINRKLWIHGEGPDDSALLRKSDGKMCCLGFYGIACGLSLEDLTDKKQPNDVKGYPEWLLYSYLDGLDRVTYNGVSTVCSALMSTNDRMKISDEEREHRIAEMFAANNVQVEFVD